MMQRLLESREMRHPPRTAGASQIRANAPVIDLGLRAKRSDVFQTLGSNLDQYGVGRVPLAR